MTDKTKLPVKIGQVDKSKKSNDHEMFVAINNLIHTILRNKMETQSFNKAGQLRAMRNEALHDGKPPLVFGSEIEVAWADDGPYEKIVWGTRDGMRNDENISVIEDGIAGCIVANSGPPVTLQDILRMAHIVIPFDFVSILADVSVRETHNWGYVEICTLDLTEDIENQTEEVLESLIQVLKG